MQPKSGQVYYTFLSRKAYYSSQVRVCAGTPLILSRDAQREHFAITLNNCSISQYQAVTTLYHRPSSLYSPDSTCIVESSNFLFNVVLYHAR